MRRRTDRALSSAEVALWAHVARQVRPISGQRRAAMDEMMKALVSEPPPSDAPSAVKASAKPAGKNGAVQLPPAKPAQQPLGPLERKVRTQLKRGIQPIEGVIDLHGLRQDEAQNALTAFLYRRQQQGAKLVLVVTGKGSAGASSHSDFHGDERGVLRRMVPHWLHLPTLRPLIAGYDEADQRHGGSGALYIRLRKLRDGSL